MPSAYLIPADYAAYGLAGDTTNTQVSTASALIDTHLQRPEGLVWMPDGLGLPCYMLGLTPKLTFTAPVALTAGSTPTIALAAAAAGLADLLGEVLVLDRSTTNITEATIITAVDNEAGTVTLSKLAFSHASGAKMEAGLTIVEERPVAAKRSIARVSRWPLVRLISGMGRYAYGRRSDQISGIYADANLLATTQIFGGAPQWSPFDVRQADVSVATGEIWVPAGMLLAYYSEVRLRYVAGYPQDSVPTAIKEATARLVIKAQTFGGTDPMFKIHQAGGTKLERWSDSDIDTDTKALLEPYMLKMYF